MILTLTVDDVGGLLFSHRASLTESREWILRNRLQVGKQCQWPTAIGNKYLRIHKLLHGKSINLPPTTARYQQQIGVTRPAATSSQSAHRHTQTILQIASAFVSRISSALIILEFRALVFRYPFANIIMVVSKEAGKDLPLFIPPRKRQLSKKCNGGHNYVDHIVTVQVRKLYQSRQICVCQYSTIFQTGPQHQTLANRQRPIAQRIVATPSSSPSARHQQVHR